jgi:glycosyltransferase involved in cell wall biosynthesis
MPLKPRVCLVSPYEHGGGAEYQMSLLIDALHAAGDYEIHYLAHFVDARDRARHYAVSRVGRSAGVPRLGYVMDAPSLLGRLHELAPSLIYQRVACAYTGICALYSRRRGTPLLWHVAHDTDVSPDVLDPSRNFLRVRLEKWASAYGARHATRIVVQTEQQAELLRRNFSRRADAVIPNFHPPAAEAIDKSGPLTVMWVANLKPWKRPEAFVSLAESLVDRIGVRFVMIGATPPKPDRRGWQASLMERIRRTKNLEYLGPKSQDEVNALLGRAHIFVNTSLHEGFPNTFIQAWLRHVAVVSLDVDPDGVLERRQVGIVAHAERELAQAVRGLIDRPDIREGFAERGFRHAEAHHSIRNAEELIGLIARYRARESGDEAIAGRSPSDVHHDRTSA